MAGGGPVHIAWCVHRPTLWVLDVPRARTATPAASIRLTHRLCADLNQTATQLSQMGAQQAAASDDPLDDPSCLSEGAAQPVRSLRVPSKCALRGRTTLYKQCYTGYWWRSTSKLQATQRRSADCQTGMNNGA
eukprot:CAMPEP_0174761126 /NCGR_PEP_ID=MMETSP1094-20130205/109120_1 /TAXON_ID=156173 /ORGANISM="Chrysochromulina brevifilum, Strain UTEX LB 985" /LENGTH=132 /DNA_ID=CAMNT_0015967073 /DNA_START=70 /DNA_END=468 /DNA_ORIENTATION=-